jgi:uncharacterized cupredoxin-like copper-binding protein
MRQLVRAIILVAFAFLSNPVEAQTTVSVVNVTMRDPSSDSSLSSMEMKASPNSVKAGPIKFAVTNQSQSVVHEMILVQTDGSGKALPYNDKAGRVVESRIHRLGEVSDLKPGTSGTMTRTLKPGSYLLICNQPEHYKQGMWTSFVVTP